VYVIDTGINRNHVEFGGRAYHGYSSFNDGYGSWDPHGHGTHVAGTIGSAAYGVAKNASIYSVRVLDQYGFGSTSTVLDGINWVINNHVSPSVANMSIGGGADLMLDTAVNNLINAGVTVVVAAGNKGGDACNYSPARVENAITVGNTMLDDSRNSSSNYGICLDIFAPGTSILSTYNSSNTATATMSGTSMASPHVAGAVALYLSESPTATPAIIRNTLVGNASVDKVNNPGTGSPNRLLYTNFLIGVKDTTPEPLAPSGTISDTTPTFSWSTVSGVSLYHFEVYQGTTLIYSKYVGGGQTSYTPSTTLPADTLNWRVRAFDGSAWSSFSSEQVFTITHPVPTPWSPTGVIIDFQPTFRWSKIENSAYYHIEVYEDTDLIFSKYQNGRYNYLTSTVALPYGDLKWRVRVNYSGEWGPFSDYKDFYYQHPGFYSNFNSGSFGWEVVSGEWLITQNNYYTAFAPEYQWASISR